METVVNRLYEAMFLVDSALAASDWDGVNKAVKKILKKVKAEVVSLRKWDERSLAYPVNGKVRGTYLLCYFRADSDKIQTLEREVQLSDNIMRVLILKADHMTQEDIDKETPTDRGERLKQEAIAAATKARAEKPVEPKAEEPKPSIEPEQAEEVEQTAEPEQAEEAEQAVEAEEDVVVDAIEGEAIESSQAKDSDADDDQGPEADPVETTDEDTKE